jgi:SAM-dependent methyltransferase
MDLREVPGAPFQRHPWEKARADFFLGVLRAHVRGNELAALDVGAGDGYFADRLAAELPAVASVTGYDPNYPSHDPASAVSAHTRVRLTASRPTQAFDVVVLLDVIEHIDDDRAAMRATVSDFVKRQAWLLASAPAHGWLYADHDRVLGHRRRYSAAELRALATDAGLTIVESGQLFASLLLPRALAKLSERARGERGSAHACSTTEAHVDTAAGTWRAGALVTAAAAGVLRADAACARAASKRGLPYVGLSTWLLARRP